VVWRHSCKKGLRISRNDLYCQKLELWPTFLPLIVWVYVYDFSRNYLWKLNPVSLKLLVRKPIVTWNSRSSHPRSYIWQLQANKGSMSPYNIAGFVSEVSEDVAPKSPKIAVVDNPTVIWRPPLRGTPANIHIHLIQKLELLAYIFAADSMGLSPSLICAVGAITRIFCAIECASAV